MKTVKLVLDADGIYARYNPENVCVGYTHKTLHDRYSVNECGDYTAEQLIELGKKHGTPIVLPGECSGFLQLATSNDMGLFYAYMSLTKPEMKQEDLHGASPRHASRSDYDGKKIIFGSGEND